MHLQGPQEKYPPRHPQVPSDYGGVTFDFKTDLNAEARKPYAEALFAFLRANGIDERRVVARPGIVIAGNYLLFTEFVYQEDRDKSSKRKVRRTPQGRFTSFVTKHRKVRIVSRWAGVPRG